jgi:hypothetical protein
VSRPLEDLDAKKRKDIRVLADFIAIFCREKHGKLAREPFDIRDEDLQSRLQGLLLCPDCQRLLAHGIAKVSQCPYNPRPSCRRCQTHCYAAGYREKVRQVMRFSGMYLIKRGRLDLLLHFLK